MLVNSGGKKECNEMNFLRLNDFTHIHMQTYNFKRSILLYYTQAVCITHSFKNTKLIVTPGAYVFFFTAMPNVLM